MMKSTARITLYLLAGFLFFLGYVYSASSLQTLNRTDGVDLSPIAGPSVMPGVYGDFNPAHLTELKYREPDLGSHRVAFIPASKDRPAQVSESIPLVKDLKFENVDMNEDEDDRSFDSTLHTDTTIYGNALGGAGNLSSKDRGFFYEQNLRYDLFTTRQIDDSLSLIIDSTHSNDRREYKEGFVLNQFSLESRTPKSLLAFGHSHPEFSNYTMTQQMMGFYGTQRFQNTNVKLFSGYKAMEKDDLKNPRFVNGFRIEHQSDEAITIGLNAVTTKDVRENPGSSVDLPTLKNQVLSLNMDIKPTEHLFFFGETAGSKTEFDLRNPIGEQSATAYRAGGGYMRENLKIDGGVEEAGSAFLTVLGESPRDERAYFGNIFYELNRYIGAKLGGRVSRDNLANFKKTTLVRNQPEMTLTLCPSEYYKDLRIDFRYQPTHEYSENGNSIDRYRELTWMEVNQKAGAIRYFAGLSSNIDKDQISKTNDLFQKKS